MFCVVTFPTGQISSSLYILPHLFLIAPLYHYNVMITVFKICSSSVFSNELEVNAHYLMDIVGQLSSTSHQSEQGSCIYIYREKPYRFSCLNSQKHTCSCHPATLGILFLISYLSYVVLITELPSGNVYYNLPRFLIICTDGMREILCCQDKFKDLSCQYYWDVFNIALIKLPYVIMLFMCCFHGLPSNGLISCLHHLDIRLIAVKNSNYQYLLIHIFFYCRKAL